MYRPAVVGEIIGQYEVLRTLGEGGIARVYLVKHRKLGTRHALKILHYRSDVMAKRLLQEGRIQAQLRHPNIVAVTDVIEADGHVGLLMEYVDGATLADVLADGVPMPPKDALPLFGQLLAGVGAAHRQGVLHRDLKPGNVLLHTDGDRLVAKIADFGIAKVAADVTGGVGGAERLTRTGMSMGTPGYMAPEQLVDAARADSRADVFALGVILYEMLSGRSPFLRDDMVTTMTATSRGEHARLDTLVPSLPAGLVAAVERALAVRPDDRFASCEELGAALVAGAALAVPPGAVAATGGPNPTLVAPGAVIDAPLTLGVEPVTAEIAPARVVAVARPARPLAFAKKPWYAFIPALGPAAWAVERALVGALAPLGAAGTAIATAVRVGLAPVLLGVVVTTAGLWHVTGQLAEAERQVAEARVEVDALLGDQAQLFTEFAAAFPASEATGRLRVAFDAAQGIDERIATGRALLRQMELEAASTPAPQDRAKDLARQQLQRDMLRLRRQLDAQAQAEADADALRATPLARAAATLGLAERAAVEAP